MKRQIAARINLPIIWIVLFTDLATPTDICIDLADSMEQSF